MDMQSKLLQDKYSILRILIQCLLDLVSLNQWRENEILKWVELEQLEDEFDLETLKENFKFENDKSLMNVRKLKEGMRSRKIQFKANQVQGSEIYQ